MTTRTKVIPVSEVVKMLKEREEKVMRMRKGIAADMEMELELKVRNNPELQAKITEIEKGIFDEIRKTISEYEYEGHLSGNPAKTKIITSLKRKK